MFNGTRVIEIVSVKPCYYTNRYRRASSHSVLEGGSVNKLWRCGGQADDSKDVNVVNAIEFPFFYPDVTVRSPPASNAFNTTAPSPACADSGASYILLRQFNSHHIHAILPSTNLTVACASRSTIRSLQRGIVELSIRSRRLSMPTCLRIQTCCAICAPDVISRWSPAASR